MSRQDQSRTLAERLTDAKSFLGRYIQHSSDGPREALASMCTAIDMAEARIHHLERQLLEVPSVRDGYNQAVVQGLLATGAHMYNPGSSESRERLMNDVKRIVDDLMTSR